MPFTKGHEINVGRKLSKVWKHRISKANLGKKATLEHRRKLSLSHKGQKAWNKGKYLTKTPSYGTLHFRVRKKFGNANHCCNMFCSRKSKRFDWANVSGKYLGINDFIQLCRSCHIAWDRKLNIKIKWKF